MTTDFIQINKEDNVAVVLRDIKKGEQVQIGDKNILLKEDIPFGHKVALRDIKQNTEVIKYGYPIGCAVHPVAEGQWIHSHNLKTRLDGLLSYTYRPQLPPVSEDEPAERVFQGYLRKDGSAGTRNEIWIIPTVSCVNTTVRMIAEAARRMGGFKCDGVYAYPHNAGCSQMGEDFLITQKLLANIVRHPNAGGVLLVSLGCENNDFEHFLPLLGDIDTKRVKCMVAQDVDGDEAEEGLRLVTEIAAELEQDQRVEIPASKLKIAFKCGGSDAFSGITSNPLCGYISDWITAMGGSAVLTEVPEMFGAETILMSRADSKETFEKITTLINGFKEYYRNHDQPVYENPSPGNKRGGITTLEEKSLGCILKGGHAVVTDTLTYGGLCEKPGLSLMIGPGNDSVSITNLLSSGAQMLLFTTGRGNPLGTAIPTIKISSNSQLYKKKERWIDYNAGCILEGKSFHEAAEELWELLLEIASGVKVAKNEEYGYREIMIFKDGVML